MEKQFTCLIVGDTPSTQFLGWRLSLGNAFIILVSQYVSLDGLVSWKSNRLGANFYTPNVFTKNVSELNEKLLINDELKYNINLMIISAISLQSLEDNCKNLTPFINESTTILISCDFGVELEFIALKYFKSNCKCVLSICCNLECRQLSLGSYALVNDDNCSISIGLTYSNFGCTNTNNDDTLDNSIDLYLTNIEKVKLELANRSNSNIWNMLKFLENTKWISIQVFEDSKLMSVNLWKFIIPKVSLNILSIIYEQFDYDLLLQTQSTEIIFKDLVHELMNIAFIQTQSMIEPFCNSSTKKINFNEIIDVCKRKRDDLLNTTSTEYPEYLSLPFETYCFYHKFEFPAHILLYQPLLLSKKYKTQSSNLNFLFGFYSRLLSINGLSIYGGLSERKSTLLFANEKTISLTPTTQNLERKGSDIDTTKDRSKKDSDKKKKKKKKKKKDRSTSNNKKKKKNRSNSKISIHSTSSISRSNNKTLDVLDDISFENIKRDYYFNKSSPVNYLNQNDTNLIFSPGLEDLYLNSPYLPVIDQSVNKSAEIQSKKQISGILEGYSTDASSELESSSSGASDTYSDSSSKKSYPKKRYSNSAGIEDLDGYFEYDQDWCSFNDKHVNGSKTSRNYPDSDANFSVFDIPNFVKKFATKNCFNPILSLTRKKKHVTEDIRPYTTSSLEFQVRNNYDLISKEYYSLREQISNLNIQPNQEVRDQRRKRYIQLELKLWKLQRRFNIYRGTVKRNQTGPYDDLLDHIEILNRGNTGDILRWTTSRYGEVDSYYSIQNDRVEIMAMFQKRMNNYQNNKKQIKSGN
ncbi:hypothetical protein Kpol_1011p17 [Vanderwaltozyma polyspora DSM 70294]|uniref:Ketopantoate reductase C-terminal domain-containing protein n=1 Tax=Vanderwaltozyma polyspora (strain ATCC 22028 / DSM 70294 / BCRC 21397 / CBS 2163 / NBRC 10782 / NRRL Y-8283 / UCD 57-17) TaxID=436907 RepID=A7TQX2_VANPO|nr:uncharacterized protein Kpol_1011p17 [Vanderwaltozyma polyspora DSM 70294]EDO15345.1 hypothetical protein Kpol_1011p17 [Vanderwaltozyma polyspora DSM 70294]